jgi:ABC-type multidrug transport system ATPase subunit
MEVKLVDIWHSYDGSTYALKGVNLALESPGVYVLTGPNGSGKTTLLKVISLMIRPSRGDIVVNGAKFWDLDEKERSSLRRSVVYVHDKPILVKGSVRYNLELGLRLRGAKVSEDVIEGYIMRYELESVKDKPVSKLSAGHAKIISIVRGLLLRPQLLALDEPFTFLDSARVSLLIEDLAEVARNGGTVVVATHYMHKELRNYSEQVVELVDGEVAPHGEA